MLILEIYLAIALIVFLGLSLLFWGEDVQVHHAIFWWAISAVLWPAYAISAIAILIGCVLEARKP